MHTLVHDQLSLMNLRILRETKPTNSSVRCRLHQFREKPSAMYLNSVPTRTTECIACNPSALKPTRVTDDVNSTIVSSATEAGYSHVSETPPAGENTLSVVGPHGMGKASCVIYLRLFAEFREASPPSASDCCAHLPCRHYGRHRRRHKPIPPREFWCRFNRSSGCLPYFFTLRLPGSLVR